MHRRSLRLNLCAALLVLSGCASRVGCLANLTPADAFAATSCAKLEPFFAEWQGKLSLRDWRISYSCERRRMTADGELLLGETELDANERTASVWISPDASNAEAIVVHELLHIVIAETREADSELVEEQAVRMLVLLLRPLPPTAPQGPDSFVGRGANL